MLNIARNIYAAWNTSKQVHKELNEVEIIPIGNSTNEKNKLKNVSNKFTDFSEYDNIPLPGFTLFSVGRKNFGSTESWLVIDPRGFLVRLTNSNLEMILHVTGITEGLIQEKCIWARDNTETKMILVPVSSDRYIDAVKNTELIEGKVDKKTVQIGDTVLIQNKLQGTYLGMMSLYGPLTDYSITDTYRPQTYLRRGIIEVSPGKFHYQTDLKILKVLTKAESPMERDVALEYVNSHMDTASSVFSSTSSMSVFQYGVRGSVKLASLSATSVSMSFVEIKHLEATGLFYDGLQASDFGMLMLEDHNGDRFLVDYPYSYAHNRNQISVNSFHTCKIDLPTLGPTDKIKLFGRRVAIFSNSSDTALGNLDNFAKFYKIVKHVKDQTYV